MSEENAAAESTNAAESISQNPAEKLYDSKPEVEAETEEKPADGESSENAKPDGDESDSPDAEESEGSESDSEDKDEESSEGKESKAPETYELATDDDSPVTDEDLGKIAQYSKERGLSNEDAQQIVDMVEDGVKSYQEKLRVDLEKTSETWKQEAIKDREIGGDALGEHIQMGKMLIDKFGDDELRADLVDTGYANKASVIRFLSKIGKATNFGNDKIISGGREARSTVSPADILYPSTANN